MSELVSKVVYDDLLNRYVAVVEEKKELTLIADREIKLHTILKLRCTIEKLEELMRPKDKPYDEWQQVPRLEKWTEFFSNSEKYDDFEKLINCAKAISSDPKTLAKLIKKLYGVINAKVYGYVDDRIISTVSF